MSIDKAIPIGLIINEMVTNAFKHAFKNTLHPLVGIELQSHEKNTIQLKVFDNGVGINQTESIEQSTSFGMRMVQTLVRQLNDSFHFTIQNGTQFIIEMQNV
jgi:two-component sensor histidine kinase